MKRVYESPVMKVEGFEANEYVAACWEVRCSGMSDNDVDGRLVNDNDRHASHGVIASRLQEEPVFTKTDVEHSPWGWGWVSDTDSVDTYAIDNTSHWKVTKIDRATLAHPNTSY